MEAVRIRLVAIFVAVLCVFAATNSEGNRKVEATVLGDEDSWDVSDIDEDVGEQSWRYCRRESEDSQILKNLDLDPSQSDISRYNRVEADSTLSMKKTIHNAVTDLLPHKKEIVRDCLQKVFPSQRAKAKAGMLSGSAGFPRRYLRHRGHNHQVMRTVKITGHVSSAPSFVVAPVQHVHSPSPTPVLQPPAPALLSISDAPEPSLPPDHVDPTPPFDATSPPRVLRNILPSKDEDKNRNYVIGGIVAGSVAVIAAVGFFLLCCLKKSGSKVEPKEGQRDEKPLLNFCSSNVSAVSSQKSHGIGNPSSKDFNASSTTCDSSIVIQNSSKAESAESFGNTNFALPLPPGRVAPPAPPHAPPPPPKPRAPAPPPPPKFGRRPPNPPKPSPLGPNHRGRFSAADASEISGESDAPKTKLKPFFWDKVLASPDHSMVWHDIKAGSFQVDEEMMESLFGYVPADKNKNERGKDSPSFDSPPQLIQIIDPKKSQNLAILLKALNVTNEEVCDALEEGNELPAELIQTLLKMAPTTEEELKLRLYSGDIAQLGPAERFLKVMVEIPFAFKRLESLLFMSTFPEEFSSVKDSLAALEVACKELKNSRLFLKLLEAVLKTGNRMNNGTYRGGATAFKLDTLLKLSDVKGTDGKTTLLHFVVQEIIRSEGVRAARRLRESTSMSSVKTEDLVEDSSHEAEEYHRDLGLQVVSGLSNELENVRKAALIDKEELTTSVYKLGQSLLKSKDFINNEMKSLEGENDFREALVSFVQHAESDIMWLIEEEKRIGDLVKSTGDYFHGKAGKDEGSHLFVIVRDFLLMLDKACKDVKNSTKLPSKTPKKETLTVSPSQESRHESLPDYRDRLFPAIRERKMDDDFSSDDES